MHKIIGSLIVLSLLLVSCGGPKIVKPGDVKFDRVKAGFLCIGQVGSNNWAATHDLARNLVDTKYQWLDTVLSENVAPDDISSAVSHLVNDEKCNVIFATDPAYQTEILKAAAAYPSVVFEQCNGVKNAQNLGTYSAEAYQIYYLNGLMAGALTKSAKTGYVAAQADNQVIRHINAFALGVKAANPKASVLIRWINAWNAPDKARAAAESLISDGADALAFSENSATVVQVAAEHTIAGKQIYVFSHNSPMQAFGPDSTVSGQLLDWSILYDQILSDIHKGSWSNVDLWWRAKEGAALLGGSLTDQINQKFEIPLENIKVKTPDFGEKDSYSLVFARLDAIKNEQFEPFTGPVNDQKGIQRILPGKSLIKKDILSINWLVDNVVGELPQQ